eukprot:15341298-Heterocapsa_arctica.AAC.1
MKKLTSLLCAVAWGSLDCLMGLTLPLMAVNCPLIPALALPLLLHLSLMMMNTLTSPHWEMFDTECNVENEYCESRASSHPPSNGSDDIIPAMPCTQVKRAVLEKSVLDPCVNPYDMHE